MEGRFVRRVLLESLEPRLPLAIDLAEGTLTIVGTHKSDWVHVSLQGSDVHVKVNQAAATFPLADISQIYIIAGKKNDRIWVDGELTLPALIAAGSGNDWIWSGGGNDTIYTGAGNDRCDGGAGDDQIFGEAGNDGLRSGLGNDQMDGGVGNDHLLGGEGDDGLAGGAGNDELLGGLGDDQAAGGDGHDRVFGDEGADRLWGGSGRDHCHGGYGDDELHGGWGHDLLHGGAGNDLVHGGPGKDKEVSGSSVNLDLELAAELTSPAGITGNARFEFAAADNDTAEVVLEIQIENAPAAAVLEVHIDGTLVGSITTSDLGSGTLMFTTDADEEGELPFPDGLHLMVGATILIGTDITGTLALPI
jgi:Ca2+-binding RTX toxin-like protein